MRPAALPLLALAGKTLGRSFLLHDRQADSSEAYTSAASALISAYIPPSVLSILSASAASAASAAGVTGDPVSLIYSALEAPSQPPWFRSAVPDAYATPISQLTAAIGSLAPVTTTAGPAGSAAETVGRSGTESGGGGETPTVGQTVVVTTSTDSTGGVVTTSFTSAVVVTPTTGTETATTTGSASGDGSGSSSSSPSGSSSRGSSSTRTAASTSTSSASTNAAPGAQPTGPAAGILGLVALVFAL